MLPPGGAAVVLVLFGAGWTQAGPGAPDPHVVGLGIILVAAIAAVEASRFGIGVEPLVLGLFAVAVGLIDLILGLLADRYLGGPGTGE